MPADFDHLVRFLDDAVTAGFLPRSHREMLLVGDDPDGLLEGFAAYRPPRVTQWIDERST
ncbi:MAG: hypothetical protein U5L11_05680 [Arhodomonas sp.]|nr:hypothetical protein [Arhodomonas sp.]